MTSLLKGRGLIAVAVLLATATLESFLAPVEASVDPAFTSGSPLPLATLGLEATEGLPWVGSQRAAQFENDDDVISDVSTEGPGDWSLCSTGLTEQTTCSVGKGGFTDEKTCSAWGGAAYCSAFKGGGLCSASVLGNGRASESCSAYSAGARCSTIPTSESDSACSATGYAQCSAVDKKGAMCSVFSSEGSNCSVTQGEGGACTTFAFGITHAGAQCSAFVEGAGHCSVLNSGEPPIGPDEFGMCNG